MSPTLPAKVLLVAGASRPESNVQAVMAQCSHVAMQAGAEVRTHDLSELHLPLMVTHSAGQAQLPEVLRIREDAHWAQGFVLVTPEYHGNMSGALKNWFDFLYEELAGKLAGVLAVTGGGSGDMSIVAVKTSFNWCHGFTLPFHASARAEDFSEGVLHNAKVVDRITRVVFDVARYAPLLSQAFITAKSLGNQAAAGVAGMHAGKPV